MKNFFKLGFVALALSLSVVACTSEKTGESTDTISSDTTVETTMDSDTTVTNVVVDTDTTVTTQN